MIAVDLKNDSELQDLYRELILDHSRNPRHFGGMPDATHQAHGINPLCGDKLHLYLKLGANQEIRDAAFEGSGCAISVASASLMTDIVIGMNTEEAVQLFGEITRHLAHGGGNIAGTMDLGKLRALDGVREFPARVKCATLAWHALNSAIQQQSDPVSTE